MHFMKRRPFIIAMAAVTVAITVLVWFLRDQQAARPAGAAVPSKAEESRLANIARQKKDGITAPMLKGKERIKEEQIATQNAMPSRDTSLTSLDLSRAPSEIELIRSGQLQEPLTPTGSADPQKLSDPIMKALQEKDNLLFGQAMDAWNRNLHDKAVPLFFQHLKEFPHSPWAAESHLHIATYSLQRGYHLACIYQSEQVIKDTVKGMAAYQKALLLKANALVQEKRPEEAAKIYSEAMTTETDARRRTQATSWLVALSQSRKQ